MPTKASSPTKNKGKVFFVAKSSGPLLGRLPLNHRDYRDFRETGPEADEASISVSLITAREYYGRILSFQKFCS